MGLTQKILLFASALVVALVATSLAFTTFQANQLAHATISQGLRETREVWETFQADRYKQLKLGIRVLGNDPYFKAALGERDQATTFDSLRERGKDVGADFMLATDPAGVVVARSDRPGAAGDDLAKDPIVMKPIEKGEESETIWRQGDRLFNAVSVPMQTGPSLVGVLVAGYEINETLAGQIRKLTHSEIAYLVQDPGKPPAISVSSLGPMEAALKAAIARPDFGAGKAEMESFEIDLGGETFVGVQIPLKAAGGEVVGSALALRSLAAEMASFRRFRTSLILVSLVVMALGLGVATIASRRITGPVRTLVDLVERARDGSFSGAVTVNTGDEIGTLARTFNNLMADLRQKEQMIDFLREGMTMLKKAPSETAAGAATTMDTAALPVTLGGTGGTGKLALGQLFANRYEIINNVGSGGMGVVYRALDRQLDEEVALKVLRSEALKDDPTLVERFKQEIRLARKITHRNVLRTHDMGEANGLSYISMELLEGVTLKELIKNKGALPLGVGLSISKQMCNGLEAAHQAGVVHRDIKPQNMLIIPESGDLKIMDFGIARVSEMQKGPEASGLTSAGTVMGTPDYMPPEQAQGFPADFRSDIYSLGVVFFETFTGKLPFTGDTVMAIVMAHIQKPAPRPRTVNPRVPADLEALILRCLDKDPAKRFANVGDISDALTAISSAVDAA